MTIYINAADLFGLLVGAAAALAMIGLALRRALTRWRCPHERFHDGACDAICDRCGKNLGFIGRVGRLGN